MNKVLFVGDLYRPSQTENILKTCNSFSPVLKEIGIDYEIHVSKHNEKETNSVTFSLWEQSLVSNAFKSELSAIDLSGYLVIGFEISMVDINYLNQEGIDWINLSIHPLRFMDDLYFSLETSRNVDFARNSVSTGFIDMSVNVLKQRYNPNFIKQETRKKLCILGQLPDDKSVFINNTFKALRDYTEKLDCIVKEFDEVLYKPHPYNEDKIVDIYIQKRYNTKLLLEEDIYKVFSLEEISSFCAISSSLLYEAKSFGLESIFLDNSPLKFSKPVSYRSLLEDTVFWSKILKTSVSFNLDNLSQSLPNNYLRKLYCKWSYHTEEDLLFAEINKFQKTKLNHEVHLIKQFNEENISSVTKKISDFENSLQQTTSRVYEAKAHLIEAGEKTARAEVRAAQAEEQAARADALAARAEAQAAQAEKQATQAEVQAGRAEKQAAQAEVQAERAEKQAAHAEVQAGRAEKQANRANELIEESKELLTQAIAKHEHLAAELSHIKSRRLWRFLNPILQLEEFFHKFLKKRRMYKVYRNLRVPWHKHLYRVFAVLLHESDKPWHTHLYRCILSLLGNEKYSEPNKKRIEKKHFNEQLKNENSLLEFSKNGLKVLQITNYKIEDYNQGGKIRCYEIKNSLLESGYDVKTLSFSLGNCDQLKDYHLEIDKSSFFEKVKDGTISDWAICDYILKNETLLLNLRKFTKKFNPDIVLLEQPFLWPIVRELLEGGFIDKRCLVVNSTHNIEFKLKESIYQGVFNPTQSAEYTSVVRSLEKDATKYSDITLCVSGIDYNYFKSLNNKAHTVIFPNGTKKCTDFDSGGWVKRFKGTKNNWVFVASWHQPNIDGIRRLINSGLESLESKQTKLWVLGSVVHPISEFIKDHSKKNSVVQLVGECSNSEIAAAIDCATGIILPIWEGGGSNLKTAQALVSGKHILSTNYAFRGYEEFTSTESLLLTDEAKNLVKEMDSDNYSSNNVNRTGVEVLEWKNIFEDLPSTIKREYFKKNSIPSITTKVYFDVTSLYNLEGEVSGITRVIKSIIPCLDYIIDDFNYIIYDEKNKAFYKYNYSSNTIHERVNSLGENNLLLTFIDSWNLDEYFNSLDHLFPEKNKILVLLYDCIPIVLPHSFGPGFLEIYTNWLNDINTIDTNILTISNSSKNDFLEYVHNEGLAPNSSINVIRLGDLFETKENQALHNEFFLETPFIFCVGTVEYRKNHQVILDAYRILLSEGKEKLPKIVIAGKQGWMDNNISHQIRNDPRLKDKIILFNNLSDEQVKSLYEECLFTMYPSIYEGWGLPVAESFACGKVCILSNVSSLPEINSEVSIFCDPHDPYSWAEEIWKLVSDDKYLFSKQNKVINYFTRQNWINTASEIIIKLD